MRMSHQKLDTEIADNIAACKADMERVGVDASKDGPLLQKACEIYCKWQFNYMEKGDDFKRNYEDLRNAMSLSTSFRKGDENGTA